MARESHIHLPAKSRLQIAQEYKINYRTLSRRLKKNNIILPSGLLYPKQQKLIYSTLGYPNAGLKQIFHII